MSMNFSVKAKLETPGTAVFIAGGVSKGGCDVASAEGIYAFINSSTYLITGDLGEWSIYSATVATIICAKNLGPMSRAKGHSHCRWNVHHSKL
jgi:hypothetical protein